MMEVKLIGCTELPSHVCAQAASRCYNAKDPGKSLQHALGSGHTSVAEHASFTFDISGVSRVLLAQLTRHRIASYSVESQRYCGVEPEWVIPQTVIDAGYKDEFLAYCNAGYTLMQEIMEKGVPVEDARYLIPQGVTCSLIITMNARELLHFFSLRCCRRAQWEIRQMARQMLTLCKREAPLLFIKAGPGCVRGACPEGKLSCGNPVSIGVF
jgi:thymidylate synthase (FAD)